MTNLLEQAINSNDADHAASLIQAALGIQSEEVANTLSQASPNDPEQRARIMGESLRRGAVSCLTVRPAMLLGCR